MKNKIMKEANYPPHAEISWLEDVNAVQVKWLQLHMTLERFKEITGAVLEMMALHNSSISIANQYDSEGAINKVLLEYMTNDLVEISVNKYGVTRVLTVMPKSLGLASLSTKRWIGDVQKKDTVTMASFVNIEDCIEWIKENE